MALGRLRRRRPGADGRRQRGWPSAAGSARWRAQEAELRRAAEAARAAAEAAAERLRAAQAEERRLRQLWREAQAQAGADPRRADRHGAAGARDRSQASPPSPTPRRASRRRWSRRTSSWPRPRPRCRRWAARRRSRPTSPPRRQQTAELRSRVSESRTELITLEREHRARTRAAGGHRRSSASAGRRAAAGADQQIATLKERIAEAEAEIAKLAELPAHGRAAAPEAHERAGQGRAGAPGGRRRAGRRRHRPPPGRPGAARRAGRRRPTSARRAPASRRGSRMRARRRSRGGAPASATSSAARPTAAWRWPSSQPDAELPTPRGGRQPAHPPQGRPRAPRRRQPAGRRGPDRPHRAVRGHGQGEDRRRGGDRQAARRHRPDQRRGPQPPAGRLRHRQRPLPAPVHHAVRRRRGAPRDGRGRGPAGGRAGDHRQAARQEAGDAVAAVGRRAVADGAWR